jgi:hypothetical protein
VILFRRHVIYGPEAAIPPEFERGEIRDVEGNETQKAWHGFMPVWGVDTALEEALGELRRLQAAKRMEPWDEFEVGRIADFIERTLTNLEEFEEQYGAQPFVGGPS